MTIEELESKLGGLSIVYRELVKSQKDAAEYSKHYREAIKNGASDIDAERYALQQLNGEIKAYDKSSDIIVRQNEKVAKATDSLRSKLREAREAVASLTYEYNQLSKAEKSSDYGRDLKKRLDAAVESAGALQDAMADTAKAMRNAASDTRSLDQLTAAVNVVSSSFTGLMVISDQLGLNLEKDSVASKGLRIAMATLSVATSVQNALQKESALLQGLSATKTKILTFLTTSHAMSVGLASKALRLFGVDTVAATTATTAFGIALDAVGIGLIIAGIAAACEELKLFYTYLTEGERALNNFEKVIVSIVQWAGVLLGPIGFLLQSLANLKAVGIDVIGGINDLLGIQSDLEQDLSNSINNVNQKYQERTAMLRAIKSAGDVEIKQTKAVTDEYQALIREGILPAQMSYETYAKNRSIISKRLQEMALNEMNAEKALAQAKAHYNAAAIKETATLSEGSKSSEELTKLGDAYMRNYLNHMKAAQGQKSAIYDLANSTNAPKPSGGRSGGRSGGTSNSTNNEDPAVAKRKKEFEQEQLNIRERNLTNKEQGDKELIASEERYWRDLLVIAKRGSKEYDDAVENVYGINAKHKKSITSSIQEAFANQIDENATDEDGNIVMGSPISGNQLGGGTGTPVFSTTGLPQSATKSPKHTEEELKARYEAAKKAAQDVNEIASGFSSSVDNASQTAENLGIKKSKGALKAMAAVRASETIANGIAGIIAYNRSVDTRTELGPFVQTAMKIANATAATTQMLSAVSAIKAAGEGSTTSSWRPNASSVSQASSQIATFSTQAEDSTSRLEAAIKGQDKSVLVVEDANKANATVQVSQNNATLK